MKKTASDNTEIAYQNKDITSKMLAENFKGKTFRIYGLDLPEIRQVLPTNLPAVKANELRLDNLFELADGTVAVVDYESDYDEADKVKYLNYLTGIANRYLQEKKKCPVLRMIVIYTGDITRDQVSAEYHIGAVRLTVETAFLSELHSEEIYQRLKRKVEKNEKLDNEELMEFIILPLSYPKKEDKEKNLHQTVDLAVQIRDREQQLFILSGILVFSDKLIDRETANKIRRAIEMTQVAQIFEEEKQQALTQAAQIYEEEKQQAIRACKLQSAKDNARQIVSLMIKKNYSTEEIISVVPNYSRNDVEALRVEMSKNDKTLLGK